MKTIIIGPKDHEELRFLEEMLKKLQINMRLISEEEKEDLGLGRMMDKLKTGETVAESTITKKLNS